MRSPQDKAMISANKISLILLISMLTTNIYANNSETEMDVYDEELEEEMRFQPIYIMPEEKKESPFLGMVQKAIRIALSIAVIKMLNKENVGSANEWLKKQRNDEYPLLKALINSITNGGDTLKDLLSSSASEMLTRGAAGLGTYVVTDVSLSEIIHTPGYIFSSAKVTASAAILLLALKCYFPETFDNSQKTISKWVKKLMQGTKEDEKKAEGSEGAKSKKGGRFW